jgi:hypothetical protein
MADVMDTRTCMMADIWYAGLGKYDMGEDMLDGYLGEAITPVVHEKW